MKLSKKWWSQLVSERETGMGYQVVSIILKDGTRYNQVVIKNSDTITKIKGLNSIPFNEKDIKEIILTHDKWN